MKSGGFGAGQAWLGVALVELTTHERSSIEMGTLELSSFGDAGSTHPG